MTIMMDENEQPIEVGDAAGLILRLREENERLRQWQQGMVKKAAAGGVLDGYREMAQQLADKDAEIEGLKILVSDFRDRERELEAEIERLEKRLGFLITNFVRMASVDMSGMHTYTGIGRTIGRGHAPLDAIDRAMREREE